MGLTRPITVKRVRKVLDRARPDCLIDLHSNTLFCIARQDPDRAGQVGPEKTEVNLKIDRQALGLDGSKARLVAPEVKDFEPAKAWPTDKAITVEPQRGTLIYVAE